MLVTNNILNEKQPIHARSMHSEEKQQIQGFGHLKFFKRWVRRISPGGPCWILRFDL